MIKKLTALAPNTMMVMVEISWIEIEQQRTNFYDLESVWFKQMRSEKRGGDRVGKYGDEGREPSWWNNRGSDAAWEIVTWWRQGYMLLDER